MSVEIRWGPEVKHFSLLVITGLSAQEIDDPELKALR
jgi:hypothetical protein